MTIVKNKEDLEKKFSELIQMGTYILVSPQQNLRNANRAMIPKEQRFLHILFEENQLSWHNFSCSDANTYVPSKSYGFASQTRVLSWHGGTLNSRQAASPLFRLVEEEERPLTTLRCSPSKLGRNRAKSYCPLHGAQSQG
ncbi:hypothetical protein TNCV_3288861 [Trichonephila clavipes]|nr:hypothetical protein TNCV_3288861 [Trichonephila clavipes]